MDIFETLQASLQPYPWALTGLHLLILLLAVWLADLITRAVLVRAITRAVRLTPTDWDDALLSPRAISRLAHVVPALVVYYGINFVTGLPTGLITVVRGVASAYVVLTVALAASALLDAVGHIYEQRNPERARARPIKGYLQLVKIIMFLLTGILVIATLFNRDPLLLLSGLG